MLRIVVLEPCIAGVFETAAKEKFQTSIKYLFTILFVFLLMEMYFIFYFTFMHYGLFRTIAILIVCDNKVLSSINIKSVYSHS